MKKNLFLSFLTIILFITLLVGCSKGAAYRSVKIFSFKGTCNIIRGKKQLDLAKEMKIKNEDELQVKEDSQAILKLDNDKFVCVKENTDVKFVATGKENNTKTRLHVNNGGVIVEVKEKLKDSESFEIASSNSVMAIRGTQISFDVSKTSDSITTTFSILTGTTETFLYKDETMNSTTLIHEKMMSYTTSLNKTTDEIYKLYDKFKPVEITDTELKENYNTEIVDISNEKIDEIVNITNEFEREETKINKTIDFTISANVAYGTNPIDSISILDDINDLVNVKYLFSKTLDGEFREITDLELGTWYCKITADNAYDSIVKEFKVITAKKVVSFDLDSTFDYGTTLLSHLTFNDESVDFNENTDIKYRKSGETIFNTYDPSTLLDAGTYYVKLEGNDYSSQSKEVVINKLLKTFNITGNVEYGTNLLNEVTDTDFIYSMYICDTEDGNYQLYNVNKYYNVGTHYVKLGSTNYYTDVKYIEINSVSVELPISYEQVVNENGVILNISLGENLFLKCPFAEEKDGTNYKYNINANIKDKDGNTLDSFVLDYGNKEYNYVYTGPMNLVFEYSFNLPTDTFVILNETTDSKIFESMLYVYNQSLSIDSGGIAANVNANLSYITTERIAGLHYNIYVKLDDGEYEMYSLSSNNASYLIQNVQNYEEISVYYVALDSDDTELETSEVITYEVNNLFITDTDSYELLFNGTNTFVTYSEDKLNMYIDTGFNNNSEYDLKYRLAYSNCELQSETDYNYYNIRYIYGDSRYAVIEGVNANKIDYALYELVVTYTDSNGMVYVISYDEYDTILEPRYIYRMANIVSGEHMEGSSDPYEFEVTVDTNRIYPADDLSIDVIVDVDMEDSETYTFDNFGDDGKQTKTVETGYKYQLVVSYNYTEVMELNRAFINDLLDTDIYTSNTVITTDELFNSIKEAFKSKYGIDIIGTYRIDYIVENDVIAFAQV